MCQVNIKQKTNIANGLLYPMSPRLEEINCVYALNFLKDCIIS